jgi:hypothetical protein
MKPKPLPIALLFLGLFLAGCMNPQRASKQILRCPEYMRDNVGQVKFEMSPAALFMYGFVHPNEPGCPIHLLPFADSDVVLEEAFHSFEMRAGNDRYDEWERFYKDFHGDGTTYKNYGGLAASAVIMSIPLFGDIPVPGHVNFHATVSHFEDTAACFVHTIHGRSTADPTLARKCAAVKKFVEGGYKSIVETASDS